MFYFKINEVQFEMLVIEVIIIFLVIILGFDVIRKKKGKNSEYIGLTKKALPYVFIAIGVYMLFNIVFNS